MKRLLIGLFLLIPGVAAAQQSYGWYTEGANNNPGRRIAITVTNPLSIPLVKEGITIRRLDLPFQNIAELWLAVVDPELKPNPEPTPAQLREVGGYLMRKETNGHSIPLQVDDIDKDGIWDELFFLADLAPKETRQYYIYIDHYERGLYEHKVHGAIGNYGRHTVPFIETEHMGWKLWFPHGMDVHGKRAPMLVANYEYTTNKSGYYMPQEMGTDIMTVGQTFGGGMMSLFEDPANPENQSRAYFSPFKDQGPLKDTRYAHHVIYNGPLRSMVKVSTTNWNSGKGFYELDQYYKVVADKSWATVDVKFNKFKPHGTAVMYGAGIRKMMREYKSVNQEGWAVSMGKDVVVRSPDEDIGDEGLIVPWQGLGISIKTQFKPQYHSIKNNGGNHVFQIPVTADQSYQYMVFAGWSFGEVRNDEAEFVAYVKTESEKYNNPPVIRIYNYEEKSQKIK